MAYASPYLVTNKKGYTKHYYAESERIASRIGGGGLQDLHKGFENYPDMVGKHKESSAKLFYKVMKCLDVDALPQEDALKYLYEWLEFVEEETDCYWYHPDHLGSSSWITFSDGKAVQHLHYLPWGEDFINQKLSGFDGVRFTFSAKEKDSETGLSYFGSRYYSSDLSVWLSVDPMSDKYPSLSPYVYCANNPVKLVDPNGEEVEKPDDPPKKNNSSNQQSSYSMVSYYTQQYKKANDVTTKVNYGLKLVGAKLNFDEQKIVDAAAPYLQGLVLVNPLVGIPNDIKTVFSGYDFYGNQSGLFDRFAAGFDALSFRAAKTMKFFGVTLSKGFEKTLNFFNFTTTSYSVGSTINIQKSQSKKGVGNAQRQ